MSDHLAKSIAMTAKIERKADALLQPLDDEMRIMKWRPEFQQIMWDAVLIAVSKRLKETK